MTYTLDNRLANDTVHVCILQFCEVRLMNDAQYPWLILVPQKDNVSELHQLDLEEQMLVLQDSNLTSKVLTDLYAPETLNVAALGNIVRQLHIHHIARFTNDPAWPGPIWGKHPVQPYAADVLKKILLALQTAFSQ